MHIITDNNRYKAKLFSMRVTINDLFIVKAFVARSCVIETTNNACIKLNNGAVICGIVHKISWSIRNNNLQCIHLTPRLKLLKNKHLEHSQQIEPGNLKQHINRLLKLCGYSIRQVHWQGIHSNQTKKTIHFRGESTLNAFVRILRLFNYSFFFATEQEKEIIVIAQNDWLRIDTSRHTSSTKCFSSQQNRVVIPFLRGEHLPSSTSKELTAHDIYYKNSTFWINVYDKTPTGKTLQEFPKNNIAFIHKKIRDYYLIFFTDKNILFEASVCLILKNSQNMVYFDMPPGSKVLIDYIGTQPVIIKCLGSCDYDKDLSITNKHKALISSTSAAVFSNYGTTHLSFKNNSLNFTTSTYTDKSGEIIYHSKSIDCFNKIFHCNSIATNIRVGSIKIEGKQIENRFVRSDAFIDRSHIESKKIELSAMEAYANIDKINISSNCYATIKRCNISCDHFVINNSGSGFELLQSGIINFFGQHIGGALSINGQINKVGLGVLNIENTAADGIKPKQAVHIVLPECHSNKNNSSQSCSIAIKFEKSRLGHSSEINLLDYKQNAHDSLTDSDNYSWTNIPPGRAYLEIKQNGSAICLLNDNYSTPLHRQNINITNNSKTINFYTLPPPIIINLRDPTANRVMTSEQLSWCNDNVCLFIHGFDVEAGDFGDEIAHITTDGDAIKPHTTGFKTTVLRDASSLLQDYLQTDPSVITDDKLEPLDNINGSGAMNWLLHMENNLNVGAGFDHEHYSKFKRIIFISWASKPSNVTDYESVSDNTKSVAYEIIPLIKQLKKLNKTINIIAHSLGCAVCCHLLNKLGASNVCAPISNVFLFDAAIPDDIFSTKKPLYSRKWYMPNILYGAEKITVTHSVNDNILGPVVNSKKIKKHDMEEDIISNIASKLGAESIYNISNWLGCDVANVFNYNQQDKIYKIWRHRFKDDLPETLQQYIQEKKHIFKTDSFVRAVFDAKKYIIKHCNVKHCNYFSDGLEIKTENSGNRTFATIERAYFLLTLLHANSSFTPRPALGYSGIKITDSKVEYAVNSGQLRSWNCDAVISSHSALKEPNTKLKKIYKKIANEVGF